MVCHITILIQILRLHSFAAKLCFRYVFQNENVKIGEMVVKMLIKNRDRLDI